MTEVSMERCVLGMPHDILLEIFRRLEKDKLLEISRLCSKFGDVAGDKRLWKDVYIKYASPATFAFEELYSGPFAVKVIDLSFVGVKPPVFFQTDQIVEVKKLDLSAITADKLTMEAILAKYQITELRLNYSFIDCHGHVMGIAPEAFPNSTDLKVLSIGGIKNDSHIQTTSEYCQVFLKWLTLVLSKYCKNLKTLDLNNNYLSGSCMLAFVQHLPTSLEKLCLVGGDFSQFGNSFFELLAKRLPNLKELELCPEKVTYPALLEFKCLKALHVISSDRYDIRVLYMYIIKFPALKTVYIDIASYAFSTTKEPNLETLRAALKPHGITVRRTEHPIIDNIFWQMTKTE